MSDPLAQPAPGFFTVGPMETRFHGVEDAAARLFAQDRAIHVPHAIAPDLLATLMTICARATFVGNPVDKLGHRRIEKPAIAGNALSVVLNRAPLMRWLERVTGCAEIAGIEGRVAQFEPHSGDALDWHDDGDVRDRRLAITVDLSAHAYDGGMFEMRTKADQAMLVSHHHQVPGSALIFQVSPDLEHRVTPVRGGGPRRVFSGWFMAPEA